MNTNEVADSKGVLAFCLYLIYAYRHKNGVCAALTLPHIENIYNKIQDPRNKP